MWTLQQRQGKCSTRMHTWRANVIWKSDRSVKYWWLLNHCVSRVNDIACISRCNEIYALNVYTSSVYNELINRVRNFSKRNFSQYPRLCYISTQFNFRGKIHSGRKNRAVKRDNKWSRTEREREREETHQRWKKKKKRERRSVHAHRAV